MQINRLFEIVYILLSKKTTTASALAAHFDVSIRTIYRDIDTLSSAGIPIYTTQGKGGGISLLDDYILNKTVLTENEQDEILLALQNLNITQNPETDRILSKLSSLFNKSIVNFIEVDLTPWGRDKNNTCEFAILKNAIINHQIIEFNYLNNSGEKYCRKVEPVKLLFKVHAWYLQGFCLLKNEKRTFKISRMYDIRATEEIYKDRISEEEAETHKIQITQKTVDVLLIISPAGASRAFDEFDEKDITKNEDGSVTIKTALPQSEWLFNYILSFGPFIEVLAPQNIRETIKNRLEETIQKYKK